MSPTREACEPILVKVSSGTMCYQEQAFRECCDKVDYTKIAPSSNIWYLATRKCGRIVDGMEDFDTLLILDT